MDTLDSNSWSMLAALIVVALAAVGGWLMYRRNQSERLARRFGPEYDHTVKTLGDRSRAEAELRSRERRAEMMDIVPLAPADAQRFSQAWKALQARFVDNPKGVLTEADLLVRELMEKRGYPMGNFESRAADISVHHPEVVNHYRTAQAIALRDQRGEADTEELRKGVVHYRALFEELLETRRPDQPPMQARHAEARS